MLEAILIYYIQLCYLCIHMYICTIGDISTCDDPSQDAIQPSGLVLKDFVVFARDIAEQV